MSKSADFSGKVAVVTGAGGGMGLAVAQRLLEAGARVTLIDIKPAPENLPPHAVFDQLDISDADAVRRSIDATYQRHSRLDYLVNAAGVLWFDRDRSLVDIDLDTWDEVMTINLKSVVHTVRAAVPWMRTTGGGAMVHFSTIQCLRGDDRPQDAYQASKAGVIALSKSIAVQFARDGIRSNTLLPGPTRTPMQARWDEKPEAVEALAGRIPLERVGEPEDMAGACLFLLGQDAAFITGTELIVDGGVTALP
jgi:NAD(P)-dependent dehydrogenase (short-subunit alcohol dehydrogenase family)